MTGKTTIEFFDVAGLHKFLFHRPKTDTGIVQRYVERPLLLHKRKFDIRQWVLVTSINPLVIWMYSNYYLRFSSREYSNDNWADAEVHLTNQSVQKHSDEYGDAIDCNMWAKGQFATYMCEQLGEAGGRAAAIGTVRERKSKRELGIKINLSE